MPLRATSYSPHSLGRAYELRRGLGANVIVRGVVAMLNRFLWLEAIRAMLQQPFSLST